MIPLAPVRKALLIANSHFRDPGLRQLRAPAQDADALARVLHDPAVGDFEIRLLRDKPSRVIKEELEDFFLDRDRNDLLLVYISSHGIKDEDGRLHFAATNTRLRLLDSTAFDSEFVKRQLDRSHCRRIVVLLDCCFAGAFTRGFTSRASAGTVDATEQLRGRGRAIITASGAMEYAFEQTPAGPELTANAPQNSVFTSVLVAGLDSGDADVNDDGHIDLDDLYEYVYDQVRATTPNQTPGKTVLGLEGDLRIARRRRPMAVASKIERKLVSVLFAEVDEPLGEAEERDPEDIFAVLNRRLERVAAEVEGFGGIAQRAIGGTIMAVFGIPHTREDDSERAVRAGLAIRDAFDGDSVDVRIAVTTGEALVQADLPMAAPIAGDSVATCARLQQAAPPGTVLVSEATGRATERSISYCPASLLALAGRTKPISVWSALEPRSRTGMDALPAEPVPLVGRDRELGLLLEAFRRARAEHRPRLVSLLGPPGIGKSRLVAELGRALDTDNETVTWRQGRSTPSGEGATYGALAEIVTAEAGIRENYTAERIERRLAVAVGRALGGEPTATPWVLGHLRLLISGDESRVQAGRRDEVFTSWRRFLYGVAAHRPLVLVFEDLHDADHALLDFIEGLVEPVGGRAASAPILVVVTARRELLDHRPGWGGSGTNSVAIELEPLSDADTLRLVETVLYHYRLPSGVGPALRAATGGNPLFTEEYVRILRDRGPIPTTEPDQDFPRLPLPDSVHAIIAAGLEALSAEERAALQDLSVLGRVGWVGALAAVSGQDRAEVEGRLERLAAREFLYRARRSSMAGEPEYGFRHVLVREVAYGQIPWLERADKHRRAAAWLESLAVERSELLAHHYGRALELASAAGQAPDDLVDRARLALRQAGDRVTSLGAHVTAARYYTQALELWPPDDPERPDLELRAGKAMCLGEGRGEELLEQARDGLLALGNRERAAEAEACLGQLAYAKGRKRSPHLDRALALVADAPASHSKAEVLSHGMMHLMVADRNADALQVAREGLAIARSLGDRDVEVAALGTIGAARVNLGDAGGIDDLERCISMCTADGSSSVIAWQANLAFSYALLGDLRRCFAAREAAWELAEQFGSVLRLRWLEIERAGECYWTGRWDQAVRIAGSLARDTAGRGARHYMQSNCHLWRGRIRLARGETGGAIKDGQRALELARETGDRLNLDPALAFGARVLLAADQTVDAGKLLDELLGALSGRLLKPELGVDLAVALVELGRPVEALDEVVPSRWLDAARAYASGDPMRAAKTYADIGSRPDEAYSRLEAGRQFLLAREIARGRAEVIAARESYREVQAVAYVAEANRLLADS